MASLRHKRQAPRRPTPIKPQDPRRPNRARNKPSYTYLPLNPAQHEIRLLEIAPGRPGSRVCCRVFHASLTSEPPPEYDALSYMWSAPRLSYNITVNDDYAFDVGRNLRKALDDVRLPDAARVVWCDALCINQADDDEKGTQIQLMRRIYSDARVVRAWIDVNLGPLAGPFEDLAQLGERGGGMSLTDVHDHEYWFPVADVFRHPYWRRIWIQQELVLAREVAVHCRRQVLSGEELFEFQRQAFDSINSFKDLEHSNATSAILRYINTDTGNAGVALYGGGIKRARRLRQKASQRLRGAENGTIDSVAVKNDLPVGAVNGWLVQLFVQSRYLGVTHPHDRVYGLFGLAADYEEGEIEVDYSQSTMQVYASLFQHFIRKHDSLVFLCSGERDGVENSFVGVRVPSWLPTNGIKWTYAARGLSQACGTCTAEGAHINLQTGALHAQGILVDRISLVEDATILQGLPIPSALAWVEKFCEELWPNIATGRPFYEREEVTDALFPWATKEFYRRFLHSTTGRPTADQRLKITKALQRAAELADDPSDFNLRRIICGGYTPSTILSQGERSQALQLNMGLAGRMLVGTEKGRIGSMLLPRLAIPGDEVWVLLGCPTPVVLRKRDGVQGRHVHVGFVIIPLLMNGEAVEELRMSHRDDAIVDVAID
ncbi:heterokaryon incompatibility protein-domain-containing protein [Lasiosphaeria ovina]|uniref:Heterokaryon incompatibility protein-domain-containing protein n=1 Tax=Lasiosphaeria ovina TaxID=92902 RepID=A0AAE0N6X4_9PEZI|nr:heterokaryon incompatibility protein-domain-containing protein [Lasiosphaeria ovina]